MNRALLIAAASAIAIAAGAAHAGEVYAGAGLPGVMLGYAESIDANFTVRGDWATLGSREKQTTQEGVKYDATGSFSRVGLFADWFVSGAFRLTGGATFNRLKADLVARGDGVTQFTIGGQTFTSDPADRLNVKISYPKVTPYLGVGYGHQLSQSWGFTFDLGASYGRATVSATRSGPNLGNTNVVTEADVNAELSELREGVAKIRYIPQISFGASYRF